MTGFTLHIGDCVEGLRELPDGSARTCVTSPPYFGLRDYGHDGQIGLEQSPTGYIERLVELFREIRRVLSDDGTVWLNLGDSYAGSWGAQGKRETPGEISRNSIRNHPKRARKTGPIREIGLKSKDLIGIPWRIAFALQTDGWYLRQDIIWHKPNPMPESVRDRCTKAHEYIFLLSKSPRYYFDAEAIAEAASGFPPGNLDGYSVPGQREGENANIGGSLHLIGSREKRNKRSVWTVSTKPFTGAHFAVFPPDLIEPCILAGSEPGDLVIDPFTGSGTTGMVAGTHGRKFYGCELNPEYAEMANERIAAAYAQGRLFA